MNEKEYYVKVQHRDDWSFAHLSRSDTKEVTHSYHQYPARFIPQLARALIQEYTKEGDLVWDSFCGSASLNVEAFRTNRRSIGTDINPTAVLISRVKTRALEPKLIEEYIEELIQAIDSDEFQDRAFYLSRGVLNGSINLLLEWFSEESLMELAHILWQIERNNINRKYHDFSLCALSSILKKSSSWLNSSVKSQKDPNKTPERPIVYFKRQLRAMMRANRTFYEENRDNITMVRVSRHNAKHKLPKLIGKVDCIITSPPYLVSYDYSDIFRLSTYCLFPQNNYARYRKAYIGTPLKKHSRSDLDEFDPYEPIVNSINDTGIRRTITEYYRNMTAYFKNAKEHLKPNKHLIMVIGDTKLRGVQIPNAYLLTCIANQSGLVLDKAYSREIPVKILPTLRDAKTGRFTNKSNGNYAERYSKEYVLVFRRNSG